MIRALAACLALGLGGAAQAESVAAAHTAHLRALDRLSGELQDLSVPIGAQTHIDRLAISVIECRYPVDNPAGDAYAFLLINDAETGSQLFEGWMVASSPALNAFDHMRYDIWVIRCTNS